MKWPFKLLVWALAATFGLCVRQFGSSLFQRNAERAHAALNTVIAEHQWLHPQETGDKKK